MKMRPIVSLVLIISLIWNSLYPQQPMPQAAPAKKSKLESVKNFLQQKASCLALGSECTRQDELALYYSLGFISGSSIPTKIFSELLYKKATHNQPSTAKKVATKAALTTAQALFEVMVSMGIFYGTNMYHAYQEKQGKTGDASMYMDQPHKRARLPLGSVVAHPLISGIYRRLSTVFFIVKDFEGIMKRSSNFVSFTKEVGNTLAMNAKCIYSESYCIGGPDRTPDVIGGMWPNLTSSFERRATLYFWLGYISGLATKIGLRFMGNAISKQLDEIKQSIALPFSTQF